MIGINGENRCHKTRSRFHLDRPRQVGRHHIPKLDIDPSQLGVVHVADLTNLQV